MSSTEMEDQISSDNIPIIQITENGIEGFEILCRLCANKSDNLIPIYSEEGVSNDLSTKMNLYLPVKVSETDSLPLQCCFQCASTVLNWHELVIASVEADKRLRELHTEAEKHLQEQSEHFMQTIEDKSDIKMDSDDDRYADTKIIIEEDVLLDLPDVDPLETDSVNEESTTPKPLASSEVPQKSAEKHVKFKTYSTIIKKCLIEEDDPLDSPGIDPLESVSIKKIKENATTNLLASRKGAEKNFRCNTCKKIIKESLVPHHKKICNHKLQELKTFKIFECDICNKQFSRKFETRKHRETHFKDAKTEKTAKEETQDKDAKIEKTAKDVTHFKDANTAEDVKHFKDVKPSKDVSPSYPCDICNKPFTRKHDMNKHRKRHSADAVSLRKTPRKDVKDVSHIYPCHLCKKSYIRKNELMRHWKINHKDAPPLDASKITKQLNEPNITFQCHICNSTFKSKDVFLEHCSTHQDTDVPDNATTIKQTEEDKSQEHDNGATKSSTVKVEEDEADKSNSEHDAEEDRSDSDYNGTSEDEEDESDSNEQLDLLEKYKTIGTNGVTLYKCNVCVKEFLIANEFVQHFKLHSSNVSLHKKKRDNPTPCDICSRMFTRKYCMLRHRKSVHKSAPEYIDVKQEYRNRIWEKCGIYNNDLKKTVYKCDICKRIWRDKYRFAVHHENHKPLLKKVKEIKEPSNCICEKCGSLFKTPGGLRRHIKEVHDCIKNHICHICNLGFKNTKSLGEHINRHTNNRPYVCEICGKAFRQKSTLYIHKVYHKKDFKFFCNYCDFKARRYGHLKHHSSIHTGERPFTCEVCGFKFRLATMLKKHMYTHKNESFPCDICGETFRQPRYVTRHKRNKHSEDKVEINRAVREIQNDVPTEETESIKTV